MPLLTEVLEEKQKVLIVSKKSYRFLDYFKKCLKKYAVDIFISPSSPGNFHIFDYCFFIDEVPSLAKLKKSQTYFIFFLLNKKNLSSSLLKELKKYKVIKVNSEDLKTQEVDRILWFIFSQTQEKTLKIETSFPRLKKIKTLNSLQLKIKQLSTKKNLIIFSLLVVLFLHFLFIPFLLTSSFFTYLSFQALKKEQVESSQSSLNKATTFHLTTKKLYSFSRPSLLFFNLALFPDNLIDINQKSQLIINQAIILLKNCKEIQKVIFQKNKTEEEISELKLRFVKLHQGLKTMVNQSLFLAQKINFPLIFFKKLNQQLLELSELVGKADKVVSYLELVLSTYEPKKYLILFVNNMELRPGGGFIGSFGILTTKYFTLDDLKIYDVYDADGQLTAHIPPPKPIEKYLQLPHWFLRDSNFSPDFLEDYNQALFFLDKEIGMTDFSGGMVITTSAIENILSVFGNLYLPDYKEYINDKNFYLKTQLYVEKNFFPGSIQKKVFLSSLINQIFIKAEDISLAKLGLAIKKSLDEKQIVVYLDDDKIQSLIDSSYWSGRVIEPKCTLPQESCLIDYLFPYDANVGANKANLFINRFFNLKTTIDSQGNINHLFSLSYINSSPGETFPTGYYRNYLQLLLPLNSTIKTITKDGVLVEDVDQKDDLYKTIGLYFEVPPKKTVEIKIAYQLQEKLTGDKLYQLVVQKQIGSSNSDLVLQFSLAKNITLTNHNFSPIVKDSEIVYNTSLSTDKIFLMELNKNE